MRKYLRHRVWNVVDVKELIALEYPDFNVKYRGYAEKHDFFELCYVEHGVLSLLLEGEMHRLTQGSVFLTGPGQTHAYFPSEYDGCRAFVICFASSSQSLKALANVTLRASEDELLTLERIIEESRESFYMDGCDELMVRESARFGGQQAILLQLEYLLICLLRGLTERNHEVVLLSGDRFYADLARVVKEFFAEHIRENVTLETLCKKMHYSQSFLCKTFKEQTGESLIHCFNRMKSEEAKKLLSETYWPISQISSYLGFYEAKYFSALFKRYTGDTPTEYRQKNKKGENE